MYRSSEEQVFGLVARVRDRALRLLQSDAAAPATIDDEAEREALALAAKVELRLPALAATFELPPLAVDALVCLVAVEYEPFLRTLLQARQRELGKPWIELGTLAELLELPTPRLPALGALFAPQGILRRWALARVDEAAGETPVVATKVKIAARIAQHLAGDDSLPPGLQLLAHPRAVLAESLVPAAASEGVVSRVRRALLGDEALVVEIAGPPSTGKRFFAEGLAAELGLPLLIADLAVVEPRDLAERLAEVRRETRLGNALPCLAHWDVHLPGSAGPSEDPGAAPVGPRRMPVPLARFFEENARVVVVTALEREPLLELHAPLLAHVAVPFPTPSQRASLLEAALARHEAAVDDEIDFVATARRFAIDPGRIEVAARAALELATERAADAGGAEQVTRTDLAEACRHQLRHDLKSLAVRVTASHKWEDLVIPVDVYHSLQEMIAYLRHAQKVYDDWGFGSRHSLAQGVSALFSGPPGTGKTMCASVMARELDMELFRVDLSRIVSKWIGETEKNLGKVFDEAQRSNAIILFDEADSLFAKRTDVKSSVDRYANLEVNFLLQRMEAFSGVTILTTNFEDTLDTAFKRRLTFRMRFEKPDAGARAALWRKVFPKAADLSSDVDPEKLGALYDMAGGNIRNAAVRAAFLAASEERAIDMATCMLASERESREMGLLTKSAARAAVAPATDEAADDVDEAPPPAASGGRSARGASEKARLVPITHPRNRR